MIRVTKIDKKKQRTNKKNKKETTPEILYPPLHTTRLVCTLPRAFFTRVCVCVCVYARVCVYVNWVLYYN
jgi:hypothetical protein